MTKEAFLKALEALEMRAYRSTDPNCEDSAHDPAVVLANLIALLAEQVERDE